MAEKTRYSDAELEEFRAIIMEKLELAQRDYDRLKSSIMNKDGNDTDDTSPTYKVLEEGANTLSKEETTRLAARQPGRFFLTRISLVTAFIYRFSAPAAIDKNSADNAAAATYPARRERRFSPIISSIIYFGKSIATNGSAASSMDSTNAART